MKAVLIDVDYITKNNRAVIRLVLKRKRFFRLYDENFEPYFYLSPRGSLVEAEKELRGVKVNDAKGNTAGVTRVQRVKKNFFGEDKEVLQVFVPHPSLVPLFRERAGEIGECFEHNILFGRRYLIDKGLAPLDEIEFKRKGKNILGITGACEAVPSFRSLAFDIETYNPQGMPREERDPVVMISFAGDGSGGAARGESTGGGEASGAHGAWGNSGVLTFKDCGRNFARVFASEAEALSAFTRLVKEKDAELLIGYNSTNFDLPYLKGRAKALGMQLALGRDGSAFKLRRKGMLTSAKITGRVHVDLYPVIRFMGVIGALHSYRYTLGEAYSEIVGGQKKAVEKTAIHRMWDDAGKRGELADYSLADAKATFEIAERVMPLQFELCRVARLPLQDVIGATSGQLVEALLLNKAHAENIVAPNKPRSEEAKEREGAVIEGAFVKIPTPGIYDNIAVLDFRGLYPSIICSHNVDGFTLNCACCSEKEAHVSPNGHRFCSKKKGLVPKVLGELIEKRAALKKELAGEKRGTRRHAQLDARQQALKILANSFYGMFRYARARWYSRECGESVTAWGRHYIKETEGMAEKEGFRVLYMDTDSVFLQMGSKAKEDALAFMKKVNSRLPGNMELALEGFYSRGVFVSKKGGSEKGAKKKYALLGEDGRIKIRGFELVRRDWAKIAKETQERVLNAILREGSKEKAVAIVREVIERLKNNEVPLADLAIYTQLRKSLRNYDLISPEVAAAQKAVKAGIPLEEGALVAYVITRRGAKISDKAEVLGLAKDYDAAYYINNQVLPAVLKILEELGCSEDELKGEGKQHTLAGW